MGLLPRLESHGLVTTPWVLRLDIFLWKLKFFNSSKGGVDAGFFAVCDTRILGYLVGVLDVESLVHRKEGSCCVRSRILRIIAKYWN